MKYKQTEWGFMPLKGDIVLIVLVVLSIITLIAVGKRSCIQKIIKVEKLETLTV